MKKILFIIILVFSAFLFFTTHDYKNITQVTFVNSIGIDYSEETKEFTLYFFVLNNYIIAQTGNSASFTNTHSYTAKGSDKEILLAENEIRNNSNTRFDLSHIRSLVIKDTFFKNDNILKLVNYIKNSNKFNPSFEVYTTNDNIDDIYNHEHFSEVSGYYTILVNTQNNIPVKHVTFKDLANDLYIPNYTIAYQKIKIEKGILNDSKNEYITLNFDGCSFINDQYQLTSFKYQNINGIAYTTTLINRPIILEINNIKVTFSPNKFKLKHRINDDKLKITVEIDGSFIDNNSSITINKLKELLISKLSNDLNDMNDIFINYDIDYFNVNYLTKNKSDYKNIELDCEFIINLNN